MTYPSRVWSISRYVLDGEEVPYDCPGAIALWSSKKPDSFDKLKREVYMEDLEKRLLNMREKIEREQTRIRNMEWRRRG